MPCPGTPSVYGCLVLSKATDCGKIAEVVTVSEQLFRDTLSNFFVVEELKSLMNQPGDDQLVQPLELWVGGSK